MESIEKDPFAEAVEAQSLRSKISMYAASAINYGSVNRDWANAWLTRLGAEVISGKSEYRINVAITGAFGRRVTATSRTEALALFQTQLDRVLAAGKINISSDRYDNVYGIKVTAAPEFFSGPEDAPTSAEALSPDQLKVGIRQMLKEGVAEQCWAVKYAAAALENLGLPALPELVRKTVEVPVTGTTQVVVGVFEEDGDEAVQGAVTRVLAGRTLVNVKPSEIGEPVVGMTVPDDDESPY